MEYSSTGQVMNLAQRTRLNAIHGELETLAAKTKLTTADLERAIDLENQIRLIDAGPNSGVREYGFDPLHLQERSGGNRGPGFNNGRGTGERYTRTADREESIFLRHVRTGDLGAQRELQEIRASNDTDMNIGTAADGGDAVPLGHWQGIAAKMRPLSLHTKLAMKEIPGVGTTVEVTADNEADDGAFVATNEAAAFDRDAPALTKRLLTLVKYTKKIELSVELIQDEDSKLLDYLESYVGSGMAATINSLVVTEVLASGTAALTFDAAAAVGAGEVPELLYKVAAEYMNGQPAWLMNRTTEAYIRGLFSTSQFAFGSQAGAATGNGTSAFGSTLWGLPVASDSHMPSIGASAKSLVFGDWSQMGYRLPGGLAYLRDPYTLGHLGQVRLLYFFRAAFKLLQPAGIVYGTHPT
jgi:HK97 family phage major capsid protein